MKTSTGRGKGLHKQYLVTPFINPDNQAPHGLIWPRPKFKDFQQTYKLKKYLLP